MVIRLKDYEIVNGAWKSPTMIKSKGKYTYPVLITKLQDDMGNEVRVPLSHIEIADMIEKHIWLEKMVDWDSNRKAERSVKADFFRDKIEKAEHTDAKIIRKFEKDSKERGRWREN